MSKYPYLEYPCDYTPGDNLGITREGDQILFSMYYEDEAERYIYLSLKHTRLLINDLTALLNAVF